MKNIILSLILLTNCALASINVMFFLDIDGVLNSQRSGTMFPNDPENYGLNASNVLCFTNLVALYPESKVVLHTGWNKRAFDAEWTFHGRQYRSLIPQVTNLLGQSYAGITTHIPSIEGGCKAVEVLNWINEHPGTNTLYVVIDDDIGPNSAFTDGAFPLFDLPMKHTNIMVRGINKWTGFSQNDLTSITNWLGF